MLKTRQLLPQEEIFISLKDLFSSYLICLHIANAHSGNSLPQKLPPNLPGFRKASNLKANIPFPEAIQALGNLSPTERYWELTLQCGTWFLPCSGIPTVHLSLNLLAFQMVHPPLFP